MNEKKTETFTDLEQLLARWAELVGEYFIEAQANPITKKYSITYWKSLKKGKLPESA